MSMKSMPQKPFPILTTIDGETLMTTPLPQARFVVDTLLSQGLHILAGAPKSGKSWLALWLSVMIAKGEDVWGMRVKQGTTLYLCLEDSTIRIQNRLFEITEDAPGSVHFATEAAIIGKGLEQQLENFIAVHSDTVLIIIDTLQMIRSAGFDISYANDYHELSVLKKVADRNGIAILLIHHLRKEGSADTFNRISGTTALQGAADSSFTLVQGKRGDERATLKCVGRDIEYRELELRRDENNVWLLERDSVSQPETRGDNITALLSTFMADRTFYIGTPSEIAETLSTLSDDKISERAVKRRLLQNAEELKKLGISFLYRRSNGKRLIELQRDGDDSVDKTGSGLLPKSMTLSALPGEKP
jgi:hypothetical protein